MIAVEVSVLILTKNEQRDLPDCLESVAWSDDIHVYDSYSTDETVALSEHFGAKVWQREFGENTLAFGGNESEHRNWGLENISFKYPWVFMLDADERMSPELVESVKQAVHSPGDSAAFRVLRRDFLGGTWLRHVQASSLYVRLFRHEKLHYERLVNPVSIVDGQVGQVTGYLDHFPFSKGISHWIDKHNSYSTLEAQQIIANRNANSTFSLWKAFTTGDFQERRYHQKELFYRLPLRPLFKFLILYVGKLGFLDGRAGFTYAMLQSVYEYFIVLKTRELQVQEDGRIN